MEKFKNAVMYLLFTYPFGIFIGISFWLLRLLGINKIHGWKNFPHWEKGVLVVSNHPSLLEPIILIGLFFHQYLLRPFQFGPWNIPDRKNYFENPLFYLMRPRLIPIARGNKRDEIKGLIKAKNVLEAGGVIILFPEGGRTYKGDDFLVSQQGNKIRRFKSGFAWLAVKTGATVLPVWVEGTDKVLPNADKASYSFPRFWRKTAIRLGQPLQFRGESLEEITQIVETAVLALADVGGD